MEKAALKARLAKGGKAPAGGKYQMNLSTMARLLEALVLKAMPNQGLASSFLDPLCSHFIDILPDSDALFKPLAGIYGRLLRTLLNSREYRSLLTPSYTLNLLHLCRFALIGHDDAEQPDRGGNSGSKENDESRYNLKKVSSSSLSSAEMVDFARCFQCLVLSLPRDLSSQNGQQASYLFASISLFFKQYPQESGAHPILLSTANHVLWEYALNDIPASYKFCSALAPRILKYWDSKRLMKGFLIPFLRIYLGLMDAQKIIHSIELKSSDLLLIWDALSKDLTSRFSPPPVMSHVDALEFLKHHNPDDTRLDPLESGASISSTSLESYGFSEFLALAGSLILDFQATDLEVHSKTCYGCHHRIHHISVFSFLSKCALQDGSSTEKSLASQVLFCLASSHSHRLDEGQLQELCLALKGGSLELSCNDNIWLTMGLANLVSTVVKESSALFETQYHGIVSDNIERTTSDAFLYLSTVIIKQSTVMLKKTLSLRPVVNWTQALSLSDHSIRFLELLLSISSPSASDVQSCLSWVFKELKSGKTSSPVSLVSFLCSLAGVRFEIQGRLNQNTDRLRPRYSPDVDETLLSEWRQSRFTTILAFMLEGPKVFLEPSLKLVKSKSNQKQTAKHCIETIVKCINALPEDPQADRSGFALLTFSLIDLLQLWKCHGILAARLLTSTEVVAALKKLLSLCQGMDFISTEISRELHALRTLGDIRVHTLWPLEMQCVQSWVTKFATRTFVSLEAGPTAPVKRKRQRENLSDSDDDFVMTSSVSNGSSSKMTSGVSITASYFGFAAPCQYQDWKGQWGPALGNLSQIVAQRQFLGASVMSVSDAEWCWIEKILESDFLFLEDSLVIFYDELISWVEASVERLSEGKRLKGLKDANLYFDQRKSFLWCRFSLDTFKFLRIPKIHG